jgi:tetraacyldisaccharide 4'-kinase
MISDFFLRSFRILLLPFAFVYWFIIWIRNKLYDYKILRSTSFGLPIISVGNLSVGGTGKSPMVEYLVSLLKNKYKIATLSRGYKRKTRGYALAYENTTALEIGDEPMQFHLKFPDIAVAVGEERIFAIPQLLHDRPETQLIILDDAFQHRAIEAGIDILLTDHDNLFVHDFYLPTGDLRDIKSSYKRAKIIVVTKCHPELRVEQKNKIIDQINPQSHQEIYFTAIKYGQCYHLQTKAGIEIKGTTEVLLVTGIANPSSLKKLLEKYCEKYYLLQYADHHIFTIDDLKDIRDRFEEIDTTDKMILTTEKDAVRLAKFGQELEGLPMYVIPIRHHFLFNEGEKFNTTIESFIKNFERN